jgi:hypothetical protein
MMSGGCPKWFWQKKKDHCEHLVRCFYGNHNYSKVCCKCGTYECNEPHSEIPDGHGQNYPCPPVKLVRVQHTNPLDMYCP